MCLSWPQIMHSFALFSLIQWAMTRPYITQLVLMAHSFLVMFTPCNFCALLCIQGRNLWSWYHPNGPFTSVIMDLWVDLTLEAAMWRHCVKHCNINIHRNNIQSIYMYLYPDPLCNYMQIGRNSAYVHDQMFAICHDSHIPIRPPHIKCHCALSTTKRYNVTLLTI